MLRLARPLLATCAAAALQACQGTFVLPNGNDTDGETVADEDGSETNATSTTMSDATATLTTTSSEGESSADSTSDATDDSSTSGSSTTTGSSSSSTGTSTTQGTSSTDSTSTTDSDDTDSTSTSTSSTSTTGTSSSEGTTTTETGTTTGTSTSTSTTGTSTSTTGTSTSTTTSTTTGTSTSTTGTSTSTTGTSSSSTTGTPTCADHADECSSNATCIDGQSGFICECNEYFDTDGFTCDALCGNGVTDPGEENDPSIGVNFLNLDYDPLTCRWDFSEVQQLYCDSFCSWAGATGCDQADADVFCKLRLDDPDAVASTFQVADVLDVPGFPCFQGGQGTLLGSAGKFSSRGWANEIRWVDSGFVGSHGSGDVILGSSIVCTAPLDPRGTP